MTQPNLLALAKRGNPDAIASLMNRSLQPKGIGAKVTRQGDRLQILMESDQTVNPQILTAFVRDGLRNLGLESIRSVEILGLQTGQSRPAWSQTLDLGAGERPVASPPTAPPPPPRPAAPPPRAMARQPEPPRPPAPPQPTTRIQTGQSTAIQANHGTTAEPVSDSTAASSVAQPSRSQDADPDTGFADHFDVVDTLPDLFEETPSAADTDAKSPVEAHTHSEYVVEDWSSDDASSSDAPADPSVFAADAAADTIQDAAYVEKDEDAAAPKSADSQRGDIVHLKASSYPGIYSRDARNKGNNPILFAAVSLVTAGWIAGLIGYSLWLYFTTPISVGEPGAAVPAQSSQPSAEDSSDETDADLTAALPTEEEIAALVEASTEKAASAAALTQTAQSVDDWNLVVSQWQQAIALLQQVPESIPDYAAVQNQLAEYQSSLAAAEQQAASLPDVVTASLPSTVVTVAGDTACPATPADSSLPLALTDVRLTSDGATAQQIVGCITNNTDQTIASVFVSYQGSLVDGEAVLPPAEPANSDTAAPADAPVSTPVTDATTNLVNTVTPADPSTEESTDNSTLQGQGVLTFSDLAPGETVPFRSGFEVPPNLASFEIQTVSWLPIGATETQQLDISLLLSTQ